MCLSKGQVGPYNLMLGFVLTSLLLTLTGLKKSCILILLKILSIQFIRLKVFLCFNYIIYLI